MIVIGIDPGLPGAIGVIGHRAEFLYLQDIPTITRQGKKAHVERQVNGAALADIVREYMKNYDRNEIHAFIEMPIAFPGLHIAAVGASFHTAGVIEGVIGALHIAHTLVRPTDWKKVLKLGRDKEQARAMAVRLFPEASEYLSRKKDHNRAEAMLLAKYGHGLVA